MAACFLCVRRGQVCRAYLEAYEMYLIRTDTTDPAYNLAAEEFLLKQKRGDIFYLWRNKPSIIIGKNQNAYSEIDVDYVRDHGIQVVRRLTGGGAVFHDLGNINFTFIATQKEAGADVSFERFTRPVVDFLRSLGLDAAFSGRNDIQVSGYKISGNAQTRFGDRFMHHGTLLFGANMTDLSRALTVHPLKIQGKSIQSVRARVANISEFLKEPMEITEFMDKLLAFVKAKYPDSEAYTLSKEDHAQIGRLCAEKYAQWGWNFGENPAYSFQKTAKFDGGLIEVRMDIDGERITGIRIAGDFFGVAEISELEAALTGVSHEPEAIRAALAGMDLVPYLGGITTEQLIQTMF